MVHTAHTAHINNIESSPHGHNISLQLNTTPPVPVELLSALPSLKLIVCTHDINYKYNDDTILLIVNLMSDRFSRLKLTTNTHITQ